MTKAKLNTAKPPPQANLYHSIFFYCNIIILHCTAFNFYYYCKRKYKNCPKLFYFFLCPVPVIIFIQYSCMKLNGGNWFRNIFLVLLLVKLWLLTCMVLNFYDNFKGQRCMIQILKSASFYPNLNQSNNNFSFNFLKLQISCHYNQNPTDLQIALQLAAQATTINCTRDAYTNLLRKCFDDSQKVALNQLQFHDHKNAFPVKKIKCCFLSSSSLFIISIIIYFCSNAIRD